MSAEWSVILKCTDKEQIEAVKNCPIVVEQFEEKNFTFVDYMRISGLAIYFTDQDYVEDDYDLELGDYDLPCYVVYDNLQIDLCKYLAEASPSQSFSLTAYIDYQVDGSAFDQTIVYNDGEMSVITKKGYFGISDVSLAYECAYLGKTEFGLEDYMPNFTELDEESIDCLKFVVCNVPKSYSKEISECEKLGIAVIGERDFIRQHVPEQFLEIDRKKDWSNVQFADDELCIETEEMQFVLIDGKIIKDEK